MESQTSSLMWCMSWSEWQKWTRRLTESERWSPIRVVRRWHNFCSRSKVWDIQKSHKSSVQDICMGQPCKTEGEEEKGKRHFQQTKVSCWPNKAVGLVLQYCLTVCKTCLLGQTLHWSLLETTSTQENEGKPGRFLWHQHRLERRWRAETGGECWDQTKYWKQSVLRELQCLSIHCNTLWLPLLFHSCSQALHKHQNSSDIFQSHPTTWTCLRSKTSEPRYPRPSGTLATLSWPMEPPCRISHPGNVFSLEKFRHCKLGL